MVGELKLSLYGTRDAAQNWASEYTTFLQNIGFVKGYASPCNFQCDARGISLTVHGDDFIIVGGESQLEWLGGKMRERYELKMEVLGTKATQTEEVRILNRVIRWTTSAIEYEPDQRHVEKILRDLDLEKAKPVPRLLPKFQKI